MNRGGSNISSGAARAGTSSGRAESVVLENSDHNNLNRFSKSKENNFRMEQETTLSRRSHEDVASRPDTGGNLTTTTTSEDSEGFEEEIKRCPTESCMLLLLSKKLRSHGQYCIGDPKLYSTLTDAAQFISVFCANNPECQDRLRLSGVLGTLVDTFVIVFQTHLEDQVSPLRYRKLIQCWSQICSALWNAVDNPTNKKNQEFILGKLLSKKDFKLMDFVANSSHSIEKQTEEYVIPIIQLFKGLIDDNLKTQEMLGSSKQFLADLIESFRLRVQLTQMEAVMWKSVDMMACLLSLLLQFENNTSLDQGSGSLDTFRTKIDRKLYNLIGPCCSFLDRNEDVGVSQSVGTIFLLASLFSRSLENVHRFNNCKGNELIVKIHGADHSESVTVAMRALMNVLNFQNKLIRPPTASGIDVDMEQSNCSRNSSKCIVPYDNSTQLSGHGSPEGFKTPRTTLEHMSKSNLEDRCHFLDGWLQMASNQSSVSTYSTSIPKSYRRRRPSPASTVSNSTVSNLSKYKNPSVYGSPTVRSRDAHHFQPPLKRRRPLSDCSISGSVLENDDDRASLISIVKMHIPKASIQCQQLPCSNKLTEEISSSDVMKILGELEPCEVMETNKHLVFFCAPGSQNQKPESSVGSKNMRPNVPSRQENIRPTPNPTLRNQSSKSYGFFGTIFNWLFN